ncbi:coadhesin-like isoform X2 [Mercenaria mercenaria]|uniref:coadhesin-like isoform X2 n=1 Tax=Mercenaria mercenaria TaxID=6596 RepID=UPI00234F223B|nr:coadhesin-like isoform X2 [Mercenaria mercenaria]
MPGIIWIWLLVNVEQIYTLECYSCTSTDVNASCNNTVSCKAQQSCFKDVSTHVTVHGCIDNTQCDLNNGASSIVGRSVNARANCHECCSTNMCNAGLCTHPEPATCENDETVDCSKLNTLFGVCNDKHHAKTVCAKFCGLCNMADGNWAAWSSWSNCDVTCGIGVDSRTRTCTNPAPRDGGYDCVGNSTEHRTCRRDVCPVSGGWSQWGNWESCSVTCGVGIQKRHRSCSNPYPSGLGLHCFGEALDVEICRPGPCADGGWTDWSTWTKCSATCGGGFESRKRTCSNPVPSALGRYCDGDSTEIVSCNTDACASSGGQAIAFQSKDSVDETVKSNQTIVFANTSLNEGNGYDNNTGVFTAPRDGTYLFTIQMCLYGQNYFHWAIMANDAELKKGYFGDGSYNKCYTADAVALLKAGDHVSVKSTTGSAKLLQDGDKWNTFTGVLLN